MGGGGRRHSNIWIAYSDLFSNLATFLFISAVGIFAAIGSGALGLPGAGSGRACSIAPSVDAALKGSGSILKLADATVVEAGTAPGCSRYYITGDYRFRTASLFSFTGTAGSRMSQEELRNRVCRPVWAALANNDFKDGRIRFIALAGAYGTGGYPAVCGAPQVKEPSIDGFPRHRRHAEVISDCVVRRSPEAYATCEKLRACMKAAYGSRSTWCRQIQAAYLAASQSDSACRRQFAELQAKLIYDQCAAVSDDQKEDQMFEGATMVPEASRPDGRRQLWGRVDFESRAAEATAAGRAAPPPGTILVEIRPAR